MFLHSPFPTVPGISLARLIIVINVFLFLLMIAIGVLAGFEPRLDRRMLIGDGLALVSAITFGLYSVAGRSQRDRYGLFTYAGTVYGLAALWAAPLAALNLNLSGVTFRSVLAAFGTAKRRLGG